MTIHVSQLARVNHFYNKLFNEEDKDHPDNRAVSIYESAIYRALGKITSDKEKQEEIFDVIVKKFYCNRTGTYKDICDELRKLGYEILEG